METISSASRRASTESHSIPTLCTRRCLHPRTQSTSRNRAASLVARVVVSSMGHTAQLTVYNSFPKQAYISASPLLHPPLMLTCHAEKCTVATPSQAQGAL